MGWGSELVVKCVRRNGEEKKNMRKSNSKGLEKSGSRLLGWEIQINEKRS